MCVYVCVCVCVKQEHFSTFPTARLGAVIIPVVREIKVEPALFSELANQVLFD